MINILKEVLISVGKGILSACVFTIAYKINELIWKF